jgi:hypothetical protein
MLIKTNNRKEAYDQAINLWLKESPENVDVCMKVILQNKQRQREIHDSYGGSKDNPKDLRIGLSLPLGLYYTLVHYERMQDKWRDKKVEFMNSREDLVWFAKNYPQFVIAERI